MTTTDPTTGHPQDAGTADRQPADPSSVRDAVAAALDLAPGDLADTDDLFDLGLDSLALIRLVAGWRRDGGSVTFEDLADNPTLAAWQSLLGRAASDAVEPAPITAPVDPKAPFDLATMQHAYWIGRQPGQPYSGVAAHFYAELDGQGVDPERLARALHALTARHGMLRARFDDDGRQRIAPMDSATRLVTHDLRKASPEAVERRLTELRDRYSHQRMDVARGEVLTVALTLLPGGATRLHIDLDMLVADALSMRILLDDLRRLYEAPQQPLPAITGSYPEYLAARTRIEHSEHERARAWWHERLRDLPGAPALPTMPDTGATAGGSRSTRLYHWLDPDHKRQLIDRATRNGITPAAALATAFAEVIGAWSDTDQFLLNLPLFARQPLVADSDRLIGDFSSSVLLDVDLREELTFTDRAQRLQAGLRAAIDHGAYAGVEVLRDLSRQHGQPVLAPVVYTSALGLGEIYDAALQACFGRPVWIISQGPQVWLDAQVTEFDEGLLLNWDVRLDVLAPGVAQAAFDAYTALVDALAAGDAAWQHPVGSLLPAAQAAVRATANATATPRSGRCLHGGFLAHAAATSDRLAAIDGERRLSYGELADRALRVSTLLADNGVRPGDPVIVTLPKGIDQIVAVLGVLAAGACYLPVSVDQPPLRRALLHDRSGARVALTDQQHADVVAAAGHATPLLLSAAGGRPPATPAQVDPRSLAYVLFTSGSTGEPKGVEVSHAAAMNTIDALNDRFAINAADRVLTLSALEFDLSVYDVFGLLTAGGTLVVLPEQQRRDASAWWRLIAKHRVTVWNTVPALLDMLLTAGTQAAGDPAAALRLVLLGGDWVGLDLPARLRHIAPGCRFAALGGMTEAAIHSTVFEVDRVDPSWSSMPWGTPLENVVCRVVDGHGRDRPDWVNGELWVGGDSLARGYRGDPARTAQRFVEHAGRRWYRSGDLARYRPDGVLEFLGRADHQVKLRGHRIELGEIEAALAAHPAVGQAVAAVVDAGASHQLAAAVTIIDQPASGPDPSVAQRRPASDPRPDFADWLSQRLPEHMRCDTVLILPALPLTLNGKVDRAAVRAALTASVLDHASAAPQGEPPRGKLETTVADAWADLLDVDRVGRQDSFFALGGDSLLATRLLGRLRDAGVAGARLADLFANPRLADFAAGLSLGAGSTGPKVTADPAHRYKPFPLTDVQRAYLVGRDEQLPLGGVGTWQYTEFDGADVDLDRLQHAWHRLVERHEMLRAVIEADGRQRILPRVPVPNIDVHDVTTADPDTTGQALADLRATRSHRVLDLSHWPLFDLAAVRYRDGDQVRTRLGVGLEYITFDALSIMTLYTELDRLYQDPDAPLPPIDLSFRDYLLQVAPDPQTTACDQEYWQHRLAELPPAPQLPTTRHPADVTRPRFTRHQHWLPPMQWQAIRDRARRHGLTPSTVLLAAYGEILGAWSGQPDLTVTLTLFNRQDAHPHIQRVLGDFTTLSLADYRPDGSFLHSTTALHRRLGADLDHREVSPTWLLRRLAQATGSMDAMPVVFTSAIGVGGDVSMDRSPSFPQPVWGIAQSPQVALDNQVLESRGGLLVTWDAVDDLFSPGVLDAMFTAYVALLDWLAGTGWDQPLPDPLPADQRAVRARVNDTATDRPPRLLHDGVFAAARRAPQAPALIWQDPDGPAQMTHGQLAHRALRVAGHLVERGLRPGEPVAITLPKGPAQITAVLGVLAAGGVYVPVGVEQPPLRAERIYHEAGAQLVIAAPGTASGGIPVVDPERAAQATPLAAPVPVDPHDLAYVIFTSGSTGTPKGVQISHDAAANTCDDIRDRFAVGPADRVLALAALDFDLSVFDIFGVLAAGAALVLPAEDERRDATAWLRLAREHAVTLWNSVPMLLDMLLVAAEPEPLPASLRLALVSGDWVGLDLPGRLAAQTSTRAEGPCRLVALGGATEAAIWSNALEVTEVPEHWRSVPYGFPLADQAYRVVDEHGRDRPDWVPGELWIGGRGVARGYRGDPQRTAQRFVDHAGRRWYRTGDLGRYWPDGTLEFLGRVDHQVKIGGHRLELGEIEAALDAHPATGRTAVVATGERQHRTLHGFVEAPHGGHPPTVDELRPFLAQRLPGYAIPARITVLDRLPLTANGKVDRAALVGHAGAEHAPAASPPTGPTESAIAGIWTELLGTEVSDRTANFFTLGGDSMTALRLVAALRQRLGADVPIRQFLATPTIADLAAAVSHDTLNENENDYDFGVL